ncbi:hypothetical protein [Streptomyces sp. NPDC088816]|uniref:hypothetical protein n=1 Tax=Streptomyces sp. NPDC088816 TaxID=3365906 RepID=UPI00380BF2DF
MTRLIRQLPGSAPDRPARRAPARALAAGAAGPDAVRLTAVGREARRGRRS